MPKNVWRETIELGRHMRQPEGAVVVLSGVALLVVGPLRGAFEAYPLIPFVSTLFLFMMPGVLLTRWLFGERSWGVSVIPVSFAASTALFGVLGVPVLLFEASLALYLWVAAALIATFLVAATFRTLRQRVSAKDDATGASSWSLWIPLVLWCAVLADASRSRVPGVYEDIWVYLAYVRDFLSTHHRLAAYEPYFGNPTGLSRVKINGWLLEQAALSRISGIDPVEMVLDYLAPTLTIVALVAFYALARTLLNNQGAALLAANVYALFFMVNLHHTFYSFGGELVGRIAEDKFVARFVFLPVALLVGYAFLESGKWRYLGAFGFVCWAVMAIHPVGLAIIGLSMGGFGLLYVALNWRTGEAWMKLASLGGVLLSGVVVPAVLVFAATGESLTAVLSDADINSNDPDVLANMAFVRPKWEHVYELDDSSYIMHPSLVLDPVVLGALLLGTPFLVRRLKSSLSAQLLLGVLWIPTVVCYVPPIATFVGDRIVLPGQLWRLAWPIPLAALLTDSWMGWEAIRRLQGALPDAGTLGVVGGRLGRLLPVALVVGMAMVVLPTAEEGAEAIHRTEDTDAKATRFCFDPIFHWMEANITEPSVVLAPDAENTCIPAYSASVDVVSLRGGLILEVLPDLEERTDERVRVPRGALDVQTFFSRPTFGEVNRILRRYEPDYAMVPKGRLRLNEHLASLPGITATDSPRQAYRLYAIDHRRLDEYLNQT